jgi:hypothetical protein
MPTKFQALHPNESKVMLSNSKGFNEGRRFNLVIDHESLKIIFLSHTLFNYGLP